MATTSPDNLWTPDSGDDYALTVDLAAFADTVQDALTSRPRTYRTDLTNAQRIALTGPDLFEGLRVRTTDTDLDWLYTGTAWVIVENGLYLIPPTSVTGGTITAGKTVLTSGDTVTINGVFSSRFRRYRVVADWTSTTGTNNGAFFRLTASGTPSTTGYDSQTQIANGTTVTGAYSPSASAFSAVSAVGTAHSGEFLLFNPGTASPTRIQGQANTFPAGLSGIGGTHTPTIAYDGLRMELTTNGGLVFTSGEIAVYGMA